MKCILIFTTMTMLLVGNVAAQAHALLDHASPLVGSTVSAAPRTVTLWFTQKISPSSSSIMVRDVNGTRVDLGKAQVDRADPATFSIGLRPLKKGTYQVRWRVLSTDAHSTEGSFNFNVGE